MVQDLKSSSFAPGASKAPQEPSFRREGQPLRVREAGGRDTEALARRTPQLSLSSGRSSRERRLELPKARTGPPELGHKTAGVKLNYGSN
eukprot:scaffold2326_cov286-Pinguiococcus_pyrenoidosus.AAC.3